MISRVFAAGSCAALMMMLAAVGTATAQPAPTMKRTAVVTGDPTELGRGREMTQQFYDGKLDELHARFSVGMQKEVTLDDLTTMHGRVNDQLGKELEIISEKATTKTMPDGEYVVYVRRVRFNRQIQTDYELHWAWSTDGKIAGFFVRKSDR